METKKCVLGREKHKCDGCRVIPSLDAKGIKVMVPKTCIILTQNIKVMTQKAFIVLRYSRKDLLMVRSHGLLRVLPSPTPR